MRATLLLVVAMLCSVVSASAQSVRGRVLDAGTGTGIPEVRVTLIGANGQKVHEVITDVNGRFALNAKDAGEYRIRTNHIGYTDVTTQAITIGAQDQITVDVKLAIAAVTLDPLTVVARRIDPRHDATPDGMYVRRLLLPPIGNSRVMLPHDPEMAGASDVRDILRWLPRQRGCTAVWWNGNLVQNPDLAAEYLDMSPELLEAVEYYRTPLDAPAVFRDLPLTMGFSNVQCSVLVLWPRTNRYLAEFAPPVIPPDVSSYTINAVAYRIGGNFAPGIGVGLEAAVLRPVRDALSVGPFVRITVHRLSADSSAALTRHNSDNMYVLPPGDRTLAVSTLGGAGEYAFRRYQPLRAQVSARAQVAQRRFNLQSTSVGNRNILVTSYGWGLGGTASVEWDIGERFAARATLGHDWLSFASYKRIETPSNPTGATWQGTSLRIGLSYSPGR